MCLNTLYLNIMSHVIADIVDAVAADKGVEPTDLELVLSEHIDCDSIKRLTNDEEIPVTITFKLPERIVAVDENGQITVDNAQRNTL